MTSAVFRNTPALSLPQTQNTAPVFEFNCLYTHDVKKKAKKWQDGLLRYHTFNKRVMVYGETRHLIGDMHWSEDAAVQEGDELQLEGTGVMVEVGDRTGELETDLIELRKSRKKDSEASRPKSVRASPTSSALSKANTQLKHRSLNALLGTPKGPTGKAALPQRSPFEDRRAEVENEEWEDGRPPKRHRAAGWSVTRTTTKTAASANKTEQPLWARTADAARSKKNATTLAGQQRLGTKEIINLSDDPPPANGFLPGLSDDALAQSSSPPKRTKTKTTTASASAGQISAGSSSPAFHAQQAKASRPATTSQARHRETSDAKVAQRRIGRDETFHRQDRRVTAPAARQDAALGSETEGRKDPKPPGHAAEYPRPVSTSTGHTLRLATTAPKKRTLLCQDQLGKKAKRVLSTKSKVAADALFQIADDDDEQEHATSAREQLKARLARIEQKKGSTSSARLASTATKSAPIELDCDSDTAKGVLSAFSEDDDDDEENEASLSEQLQTSHEASAIELRRLDQRMLPPVVPLLQEKPLLTSRAASPALPPTELPQPSERQERQFRRVLSESDRRSTSPSSRRIPGAPVRYTPSPSPRKQSHERASVPAAENTKNKGNASIVPAAPAKKGRHKMPLQKSVSLNMTSDGTSMVMLSKPFQAPSNFTKSKEPEPPSPPEDIGPWSREAFDLFTWRPSNWDEEEWRVKAGDENDANVPDMRPPPPGLSGGAALPEISEAAMAEI